MLSKQLTELVYLHNWVDSVSSFTSNDEIVLE